VGGTTVGSGSDSFTIHSLTVEIERFRALAMFPGGAPTDKKAAIKTNCRGEIFAPCKIVFRKKLTFFLQLTQLVIRYSIKLLAASLLSG